MVRTNDEIVDEGNRSKTLLKNFRVLALIIFNRIEKSYSKTFKTKFKNIPEVYKMEANLVLKDSISKYTGREYQVVISFRSSVINCIICSSIDKVVKEAMRFSGQTSPHIVKFSQNFPIELATAKPKDLQALSKTIFRWVKSSFDSI